MSANAPGRPNAHGRRSFRWRAVTLGIGVAAVVVLVLLFVPGHSSSQQIQVTPSSPGLATIVIPSAGWVTVHFDHPRTMMMIDWMGGPGGMMFNHSMMSGGDSYSFWSWGGTYHCGMAYRFAESAPTTVWVNTTWGVL